MLFLVVDDDELSRELLALLLGAHGHVVELAVSGEEAIAKLHRAGSNWDAVLTDVQMPGMAGESLGNALRAAMQHEASLLAMSGSQPAERILEGFDGFLLKPFSIDDLEAKIKEAQTNTGGADLQGLDTSSFMECDLEAEESSALQPAALNEEIYTKLSETMPAAHLDQMFSMCLTDARCRIGLMSELAATGDDIGYRAAAHAIKGGCGFIGATELYCLAESAENDGLSSISGTKVEPILAARTFNQFASACNRLERILKKRARD